MVDFKKLLGKKEITKPTNPIEIFGNLDKESGKEYLRPPQIPSFLAKREAINARIKVQFLVGCESPISVSRYGRFFPSFYTS